jgi:hypothetical protein
MKRRLQLGTAVVGLLVAAGPARAQPSTSVVMDGRGYVYYADLNTVWRISPTGNRSAIVLGVRSRQLYLDSEGRLYGEDLRTDDITGRPFHRVWRWAPEGGLSEVIGPRAGYLADYGDFGFVRDRFGVSYALQRRSGPALVRMGATGQVARITLPRPNPNYAAVLPDGRVAVTAGLDLLRVAPTRRHATVWMSDLGSLTPRVFEVPDSQWLLGMWLDAQGRLHVASYAGAAVIRLEPDGSATVVARSPTGWSPTGGMVAPDDSLWLLEHQPAGAGVRVRRIGPDGEEQVF